MADKPGLTVLQGDPFYLFPEASSLLGLFNELTQQKSHEMQHPSSTIATPVSLGLEACSREKG
jgi:hypothetical protein